VEDAHGSIIGEIDRQPVGNLLGTPGRSPSPVNHGGLSLPMLAALLIAIFAGVKLGKP